MLDDSDARISNRSHLANFFSITVRTTKASRIRTLRFTCFFFKKKRNSQIIYLISSVYFIIFIIGRQEFSYFHPNRAFLLQYLSRNSHLLTRLFTSNDCETITEELSSSLEKSVIFLRIKKHILINQEKFAGTRW